MNREISLNVHPQPPQPVQPTAKGDMNGRTVEVENGDTKSAGLFRRAMSSVGSFLVASAKFVIKATLFVTGITPLIALTKFFWNCINPKKESKEENQLALVTSNASRRSSVSEKDKDDLCEQLVSFHDSDVGKDNVSEPTAAALHEAIQEQIQAVEQNNEDPAAQKKDKKAKETTAPAVQQSPRRSERSNKGVAPRRLRFE